MKTLFALCLSAALAAGWLSTYREWSEARAACASHEVRYTAFPVRRFECVQPKEAA